MSDETNKLPTDEAELRKIRGEMVVQATNTALKVADLALKGQWVNGEFKPDIDPETKDMMQHAAAVSDQIKAGAVARADGLQDKLSATRLEAAQHRRDDVLPKAAGDKKDASEAPAEGTEEGKISDPLLAFIDKFTR